MSGQNRSTAVMQRRRPAPKALDHFPTMNPPFRLAFEFIETALELGRRAVAVLVRSAFLESAARYKRLWSKRPPAYVLQFSERVVMLEGHLVRRGSIDPFTGKKATSATAYSWLLWIAGDERETRMRWLQPSMIRLERPGDYPDYVAAGLAAGQPVTEDGQQASLLACQCCHDPDCDFDCDGEYDSPQAAAA